MFQRPNLWLINILRTNNHFMIEINQMCLEGKTNQYFVKKY